MTAAESRFRDQLAGRLRTLELKNRYRRLTLGSGVDLSSNDYLGLADHPRIRAALVAALEEGIPLGSTGSRLLRGHTRWHQRLEQRLVDFKDGASILMFNSGYDANVGVLSTLCGPGDPSARTS